MPSFLSLVAAIRGAHTLAPIEAALCDVLAAIGAAGAPARRHAPPRWLIAARDELDASTAPVRVSAVAARAGVHPVYLARVFRRAFGCSVTDYAQRRRVQRAAAAIADSRAGLAAASFAAGFADHSHLCRAFRARTELTPSMFRKLVATVPAPLAPAP